MKIVAIDGLEMTSRAAAHAHLAGRLSFADYCGENLDALHDCLGDICEETHIVIYHCNDIKLALGLYGEALLRVLKQSAEESDFLTVSFCDNAKSQTGEPKENSSD